MNDWNVQKVTVVSLERERTHMQAALLVGPRVAEQTSSTRQGPKTPETLYHNKLLYVQDRAVSVVK